VSQVWIHTAGGYAVEEGAGVCGLGQVRNESQRRPHGTRRCICWHDTQNMPTSAETKQQYTDKQNKRIMVHFEIVQRNRISCRISWKT
jgi:hypothetical protein